MAKPTPAYRRHKARNRAVVTLSDAVTKRRQDYYLGPYGSPESYERYHALLAWWESTGRRLPDKPKQTKARPSQGPLMSRILADYWRHCQNYYVKPDGTPTSKQHDIKAALQTVRALYGQAPARDFGPLALREIRGAMANRNLARSTINGRVDHIRRMFKWAASHELIPASIPEALATVPGLREGEYGVRESEPVKPVPEHMINAALPYVSEQVASLIRLQLYTAARGGELVLMRPIDLDTSGQVWLYHPADHKGRHRNQQRTIFLGPAAKELLRPWLNAKARTDAYLFDPRESGSEAGRAALNPRYKEATYRKAVTRACDKAFPPPAHLQRQRVPAKGRKHQRWETDREYQRRLGEERWEALKQWRRDHRWHPHQLRHNAATYLRKEFGIEAARLILGHQSAGITEIYAEQDREKAKDIIRRIG
jgi:integrase